jgi:hypothetical protein
LSNSDRNAQQHKAKPACYAKSMYFGKVHISGFRVLVNTEKASFLMVKKGILAAIKSCYLNKKLTYTKLNIKMVYQKI